MYENSMSSQSSVKWRLLWVCEKVKDKPSHIGRVYVLSDSNRVCFATVCEVKRLFLSMECTSFEAMQQTAWQLFLVWGWGWGWGGATCLFVVVWDTGALMQHLLGVNDLYNLIEARHHNLNELTLVSAKCRGEEYFFCNESFSMHVWNKRQLTAFLSCLIGGVPGRQALQGFVQALWSVVSVCCGERNIWSVRFWVAFALRIALQAQPVIAVSLLPGQRRTHGQIFTYLLEIVSICAAQRTYVLNAVRACDN